MQLVCIVLMGNNQPKMTPLFLVFVLGMVGIGVCQTTNKDVTTPLTATTDNDTTMLTMETSMITMTDVTDVTDVVTETVATSAVTGTTELPMTTSTIGPSTPAVSPTPEPTPPTSTWTVKNQTGAICMKMRFGARLIVLFTNTSHQLDTAIIDAPKTAFASGECKDDEPREFTLHFFHDEPFYITLTFSKSDSKFKMTDVGTAITISNSHFKNPIAYSQHWSSFSRDNFLNNSVPLGNSFNCKHSVEITELSLTLTDVLFQPFAEKAQGDFGDSIECKNQSNNNVLAITIIAVVSVIVLLSVTSCIAVFIVKKRRKSRPEDKERLVN